MNYGKKSTAKNRDVLIIRQGRITGLFRSQSMILLGDSSILRMYITMSIVLYLIATYSNENREKCIH